MSSGEGRIPCPAYAWSGGYRDLSVSGRSLSPGCLSWQFSTPSASCARFCWRSNRRSRVISLPSQRLKLALNWLSELWWDCSVCATGFITLMDRCGPLAARCAFSAKSVVPELILFGRRVPVDSHGAGGGRNRVDPVTRHRNTGCCSERVAHFLRCLHDPLWLCREHYVFARISSKCRCAKCEREHDTRASNRRTTQATKPVSYSHALIMIVFRILRKLIWRLVEDKETTLSALTINLSKNIRRTGGGAFRTSCM